MGKVPAKDYYDPKGMSHSLRKEFEGWYRARQEEGYEFDFQNELLAYCQSDVRLLKKRCMKFQEGFETLVKFNPMPHCITIASACHLYYRKTCLIPNTNVSKPVRSCHHKGRVHSKAALEWLYWKEHCEGKSEPQTSRTGDRNAHTCNQGEHKLLIGGSELYVDGFDHNKNKVYKFLGDFYHDSPMTFSDRGMRHPFYTHKTMQEAYEETLERLNAIKKAGYEVEVM